MAELLIVGNKTDNQEHVSLSEGMEFRIGRAPKEGIKIPWDPKISREHADLTYEDGVLKVRSLSSARNPIVFQGKSNTDFQMTYGDIFYVGDTTFELVELSLENTNDDILLNKRYSAAALRSIEFNHVQERIEFLCQLPQLIAESPTDEQFALSLVELLMEKIPRCYAAAVVELDVDENNELGEPKLTRLSKKEDVARFLPSNRLMKEAITRGETISHMWIKSPDDADAPTYTLSGNLDWAFCTPIPGVNSYGWCLYVAGNLELGAGIASDDDLKPDMRFTEVMSEFISAIRHVRMLKQQYTTISQCFSPKIVETLTDPKAMLTPREGKVAILFCDVRGFSKKVEDSQDDLYDLLVRVKEALGVMTRSILGNDGSIADFQGDAALAFWGWPTPNEEAAFAACKAAVRICRDFKLAQQDPNNKLYGFKVGIGIGYGNAIAGNIGSDEMTKIGVFGPVVNLTARLESMTKQLGTNILIDEATSKLLRIHLSPKDGRLRRIAKIRPVGIREPVWATEVLLPTSIDPTIGDGDVEQLESAWKLMEAGDFPGSKEILQKMPETDGPVQFLLDYIQQHDGKAPDDWEGCVVLKKK